MTIIGDGFKTWLRFILFFIFFIIGGKAFYQHAMFSDQCPERTVALSIMGLVLMFGGSEYFSEKISGVITKWLKKKIEG